MVAADTAATPSECSEGTQPLLHQALDARGWRDFKVASGAYRVASAHKAISRGEGRQSAVKPCFYVQVIQSKGAGEYQRFTPVSVDSFEGAVRICEKLQGEFDEDCEPCRVYVLDHLGVPVHAAGAISSKGHKTQAFPRRL